MALPAGLSTFTLTGGPYTDATGTVALAGVSGKLTPVDGAGKPVAVVHAATGAVIVPQSINVTVDETGSWSAAGLPYTDDAALAAPFRYSMAWNVAGRSPSPGDKVFEVPSGSGSTVDFDLLGSATGTLVTPVAVPLVTSVAGYAGAVTGAEIAADPALRAALVPFWEANETVTAGTIRMAPDGTTIERNADGTTGATYDSTEQAAWTAKGGGGGGVGGTLQAFGIYRPEDPAFGAVGDGVADDGAAINACLAAAGAAGGLVWFAPQGTYRSSVALVQDVAGFQIEGNLATIYFDHNDHDLLSLGPKGQTNVAGMDGVVRRLILRGASSDDFENSNAIAPTNYKAGIVVNSVRNALIEDCHVNNMDIAYDLRGNCFGSKLVRCRTGVTTNIGVLLRGPSGLAGVAGSGSDIEVTGFWGGGAKAAFWCEGSAGGYLFTDCKPGGGHTSFTTLQDGYGVWVAGLTYEPQTTVTADVAVDASTITVADGSAVSTNEIVINGQEIEILSKAGNTLTVATSASGGWQANYNVKTAISAGAGVQVAAGLGGIKISGGGTEGTTGIHAMRLYQDVTGLAIYNYSFNSNNDGAAGDLRKMGQVLKHTGGGSMSATFDRCEVQGAWLSAVPLSVTTRWNNANQIEERGTTHGSDSPPTFNGVTMSFLDRPMVSWSSIGGAIATFRRGVYFDGVALRGNAGAVQTSTDFTTWAPFGPSTSEFPGPVNILPAPYTIKASDAGGLLSYDNPSTAGTYTLPDANTVPAGFTVSVAQTWTGVLTVTAGPNSTGIRKPGTGLVTSVSLAGQDDVVKFVKGADNRWFALPFGAAIAP